ncbi:magnesium/cobalt transporter CorA [Aureimonas pseudogalii]|uniref:Magnesium transport protein CorA n=1 Tax=Aureimonas pseudogalii TaxID=1744844 RepID=A0A7W6MK88_9HYPH|nr:magnesium/cobalt transporter CorA [Aureimonas pseudogalii]MBB3998878.1 magnesium transporter [Aureimonas pseudogalii]
MTVVAGFVYAAGRRVRAVDLFDPASFEVEPGAFVWLGIVDPSEDELAALGRALRLHPLALEDARRAQVRPKVEVYDDELVVVTRTALRESTAIAYGKTAIFLGERHVVSVRTGSRQDHRALREQVEASPLLRRQGVDYVLYAILDFVVDSYLPIVESIEEDLLEMERRALDAFLDREEINRIFAIRRDLIRFRRILGPMEEVCGRLEHLEHAGIDAETRPYFRDVHDQVRRVSARSEGARESISSILEASSLLEQHRQGAITRQLAAWAAILAVPTAIAGLYGMNFEFMPELHWRYGYFAVLSAIAGISAFLFVRFRRSGWL